MTNLYIPRDESFSGCLIQLVDDVEFWFPPGNGSIVEYRAASRLGNYDFDYNRKRIKVSHSYNLNLVLDTIAVMHMMTQGILYL